MPTNTDNQAANAEAANQSAAQPATPTPKKKTAVGKVLADIGKDASAVVNFVGKEAGVIARLFANEEPQIQDALKNASQLVQIIKTEVNENPVVVAYLLRKVDANYTDDMLNDVLTKAATAMNITSTIVQPTLTDTIAALQAHASQLPSELAHNNFWTGLFNLVGSLVAPGTAWSKVLVFGTYIYNNFIKPKK